MRLSRQPIVGGDDFHLRRTVYTTKGHPQVGFIFLEGEKVLVYMGMFLDDYFWSIALWPEDPRYLYCAEKTMPFEQDPDYFGEDLDEMEPADFSGSAEVLEA